MAGLTVFCDTEFPGEATEILRAGLADHRLIQAAATQTSNLVSSAQDPAIAEADIALGQPDPQSALDAPRLGWIQLSSAGYTRYDDAPFRQAAAAKGLLVSSCSAIYADPCAEHLLAMMLAKARRLPECFADQRAGRWPAATRRRRASLLRGQTVLILGYGAIARRLIELLGPFQMRLIALRRSPTGDEPVEIVTDSGLDGVLGCADHVVNVLPDNPQTRGLLDRRRIGTLRRSAIVYNVGRGTTLAEDALVDALEAGELGGAYLDVTAPEPPPPEDRLWSAPRCDLTPHMAGGRDTEFVAMVEHFLANLKRFERGEPLIDRVV